MSKRIATHCLLTLTCWLALTTASRAQSAATDAETARGYMDEADNMREAGDLWAALERYQAADQLMHVPTTGIEVAKTQAMLLQLAEARATALTIAHSAEHADEPKVFGDARKEAAQLAAALAPRIPDLQLTIAPASAHAVVSIDGRPLPQLSPALPYKLNPGRHILRVEAPGFETKQENLNLAEGQHATLSLSLDAQPSHAPTPREVAAAPVVPAPAQPARSANTASRVRAYAGLAAGGALLVTGAITGIVSLTKVSDVRARCMNDVCPESARADVSTADALATISNITLPLGVLGIGYGIVELLLQEPASHDLEPAVRAGLTATGVGIDARF